MTEAVFRSLDHLSGGVAAHPEEATGLREQLQQLESQVAAVRELHQRESGWAGWKYCLHCGRDAEWPCKTIAALDGVQAQGEEQ